MNSATMLMPERDRFADEATLEFRQYICRACGLIYDEEVGDPDSGLAPGTRFKEIPEDWECPLCGVTKADFEPYVALAIDTSAKSPVEIDTARRHASGIVIVGAGTAGWAMARAIREVDGDSPITIVTGCNGDVYDKPMLSVAMAKAIGLPDLVKETGREVAIRLGVKLMSETFAVSVTPEISSLRTTRGAVKYQHLILAHGAVPRMDDCLPKSLCWAVNDLRSYTKFRESLNAKNQPQQVVLIGAGLVGCEIANDIALSGHSVVLLDVATRPLANFLSESESAELVAAWSKLPISFLGGTKVKSLVREEAGITVETDAGFTVKADLVLSATGLQTPSRLADSAGLAWHNGIAVDSLSLATNVQNIHALGDCISINGQPIRFIEPIARQARVIASRLRGDGAHFAYEHVKPVIRVKTSSKAFTV